MLLAVIGPAWLSMVGDDGTRRLDDPKDYVRREIAAALERDDVVVVPVLIGTTAMPRSGELPAVLAGLTERNGLRLSDENWDDQVAHLVRTLEPVLQRSAPVTAPLPSPPQTTPASSLASGRRPTAILSVAAVAAIVLVAALGFAAVRAFGGSSSKERGSGDGNTTVTRQTLPTLPPGFGDFGPGDTTVTLSRSSGPPGTTLTVSGTGFGKNETVVVRLVGDELGRTQTLADGSFTMHVTVLSTPFRNNRFDMEVEGNRTYRHDSAPFTVL